MRLGELTIKSHADNESGTFIHRNKKLRDQVAHDNESSNSCDWLVISMGLPLFLYEKVSAQNDRPL
jgi:hypothetical protein